MVVEEMEKEKSVEAGLNYRDMQTYSTLFQLLYDIDKGCIGEENCIPELE